jgi:hypothetical protein
VEEQKMKKLFAILALTLLLVPGFVMAQAPAGCSWEGDPCLRYGWGQADGLPFNQPGPDYADIYAGATLIYTLAPYNATPYNTMGCTGDDTLCFELYETAGWTIALDPPAGEPIELPAGGYIWWQEIDITAPCDAEVGDVDTLIAKCAYTNIAGVCAPECGDCEDPDVRPATMVPYYNADTLYVTVVASPPALGVLQDTLTLVDRGQTQAFVPFTICNQDDCAPPTLYSYAITSVGGPRIPAINQTGSATVDGGACKDVYGVIDAGTALACDYDTLTIIVWTPEPVLYDTCVQVIHVIEPEPVPLFTVPVVTILVLALILAAAVFMRRRAVSRA